MKNQCLSIPAPKAHQGPYAIGAITRAIAPPAVSGLQIATMGAALIGACAKAALLPRSVLPEPGHADRASVLGAVMEAPVSKGGIRAIAPGETGRHGNASLAVMPRKHVTQVPTIGGSADRWTSRRLSLQGRELRCLM